MYIALIILGIILFFLFVPIKAVIKKDDFFIQVLFVKIKLPKKKPSTAKEEKTAAPKKKKNTKELIKKILSLSDDIKNLASYIARKCIVIDNLEFSLDFGTEDAAQTGIATGALNGVFYTALSAVHHNTTIKKWNIQITPDFEGEKFDIQFLCIVKVRMLHIISIGIKALKLYIKFKKI